MTSDNKFLTFIKFLLNNDYREISGNICQTTKGVPLGGVLSPILFNYFINDLLELNKNINVNLVYADDLAVFFSTDNLDTVLDIIENWTVNNNMMINKLNVLLSW